MRGAERGFLLLTCRLGDPDRPVLTPGQLRNLKDRVQGAEKEILDRDLDRRDLLALGYGKAEAERILTLLGQDALLDAYLDRARRLGIGVLTLASQGYPQRLTQKLGWDCSGSLWYKGEPALLTMAAVSLVGSRELLAENAQFAREVGIQAAKQGFVLVSGNARGADRTAQEACWKAGGCVISILPGSLEEQPARDRVLYVTEQGFTESFSTFRALSRNRLIHALGDKTFVAQSRLQIGGTWAGTAQNLKRGYGDVFCFRDGSVPMKELEAMGAVLVDLEDLEDLAGLSGPTTSFF